MSEHFDVAVLGIGPGGEVAASRLLAAGTLAGSIDLPLRGRSRINSGSTKECSRARRFSRPYEGVWVAGSTISFAPSFYAAAGLAHRRVASTQPQFSKDQSRLRHS